MTIECTACHARYTIADTLVPPQGARVKCKKCGEVFSIKPPAAIPAPTAVPLVPPTPEPAPPPAEEPAAAPASAMPPPIPAAPPPAPATRPQPSPAMPPPPPPIPETPEPSHATAAFEHFVEPARGGPGPSAATAPHATTPVNTAPAPHAPFAAQREAPDPSEPAGMTASIPSTGTPIPEGLSPEERQRHERARRLARVLASDIAIYNREKRDRGIHDGNLVAVLGYEIKKSWDIYKEKVGAEFANGTPYFRDALNEIVAEGRKIF